MTIALAKSYAGIPAGSVVKLSTALEASLIAQGFATTSTAALTAGPITMNLTAGSAAIAIGAPSVVVTNSLVDANSKIFAVVSQAVADGTLLRVERIVPAAGSFAIYGTAAATGVVTVDWVIIATGQTVVNT